MDAPDNVPHAQEPRAWTVDDAQMAATALGRLCDRLSAGRPIPGDVSEWARLTMGLFTTDESPVDCRVLVAEYDAFWRALADKPRAAAAASGLPWPPSVDQVADLFDGITIPGGIIDIGQDDPVTDLPASLERRLRRLALLEARGPSPANPAFPDPLSRWKDVFSNNSAENGNTPKGGLTGDDSKEDSSDRSDGNNRVMNNNRDNSTYAIVVTLPSAEPDEDDEYDASADLYSFEGDGRVSNIASGIIEWEDITEANDGQYGNRAKPVGRGDVYDDDRAKNALDRLAPLLPAFLRRIAKVGIGYAARGSMAIEQTSEYRSQDLSDETVVFMQRGHDANDNDAQYDFDCTHGWVAGADDVSEALVEVGSIDGLPEAIAAYDPDVQMPVLMTWLDSDQLRLVVQLFGGQRAAKTARAIADADAARSLEGAAASVYRGPAFGQLLPESVAHRLAFHRWVRGCAGARDRPLYEEALSHWPEQGDVVVRADDEPDARVDPRRVSCGTDAKDDVLAAAELMGIVPGTLERQRPRLLCAPLARDAIRMGAWATFGVSPFDPALLEPYADTSGLMAQRGSWRRVCTGSATQREIAELVASARDLGLPLEDEDLSVPGRLCAKLALLMAL